MKILQVLGGFYPAQFGGTVNLCHSLSKELVRKGHEVTVYATDANPAGSRLKNVKGTKVVDGIKVHYFRNVSNWQTNKFDIPLPLGMGLTVRKEINSYDVIHIHVFRNFSNIVVHHYARKYNIPYVLDTHGSLPKTVARKGRGKLLIKWLFDITFGERILKDASKVIAESEVGVNEYKELGVSQDKIVVISPPLDIGEFSQLPPRGLFRRNLNIKEKHIVLFLGRIHWIKGLDFLVESFYELTKSRSDVILVIVGPDDGYKSTLDKLIDKLNLADKVFFTGFLSGDERLSALVDASVVIQTSIYEQGVRVPFEAILCNVPTIVTKHTGAGEILGKIDAGYLVEYENNNELRDMMQYILDDPAKAASKTRKAKEYVKANLSLEKGAEKYEGLYQELGSRRHG